MIIKKQVVFNQFSEHLNLSNLISNFRKCNQLLMLTVQPSSIVDVLTHTTNDVSRKIRAYNFIKSSESTTGIPEYQELREPWSPPEINVSMISKYSAEIEPALLVN